MPVRACRIGRPILKRRQSHRAYAARTFRRWCHALPIVPPRSRAAAGALLLGLLAGSLPALGAGLIELTPAQVQSLQITTAAVTGASSLELARLPAQIIAPLTSSRVVSVPFAGVVASVMVDDGAIVGAGAPLARIHSRDFLAAQAELARSRSEATLAHSQARRDEMLLAEGIVARARADESRARASQAQAQLAQARDALSSAFTPARTGNGEYELRAPIAGRVLQRTIAPGQAVAAFEAAFTLAADDGVDVSIQAPLEHAADYAAGQVIVMADGSRGEVVAVSGAISDGSQSVRLRAHLPAAPAWRVGQHTSVRLQLPAPADALRVAASALLADGSTTLVFVADGHRYRALPVERIGSEGEDALVRGALRVGDQVVSHNASALRAMHGE